MQQYLIQHAIDNVWCNPPQDNQLIFKAGRITKPFGELNRFKLMNRIVDLPQTGKRYHVYAIGGLQPAILGLLDIQSPWDDATWVKFSDAINSKNVLINVYTAEGVCLPRYTSYYMYTNDRDLVFAVEIDAKIPVNYNEDALYFRMYSNAYYHQDNVTPEGMYTQGKTMVVTQDILNMQLQVAVYQAKNGHVSCYANGFLIDSISPITVRIGDRVEFVYDSSVKRVVTFTVNNLNTFVSTLDGKTKYLLHHQSQQNDTIDYQDDLEIHILNPISGSRYQGAYYHRNGPGSHRMVTHRDYSVVVDYFVSIATGFLAKLGLEGVDLRRLKFEVQVKNSGYHRPLVFDDQRIFELYKLSDDQILQAMIGTNAVNPLWKAANLEASAYTELMRVDQNQVNLSLVQRAYGYNAIAKLVGDTPMKTKTSSGFQMVDLPYGLLENATVYEYDRNGAYLGNHHHSSGGQYYTGSPGAGLVEAISGKGTVHPDVKFGLTGILVPSYYNYRVYRCNLINGMPDNIWSDVTDDGGYTIVSNRVVWNDPLDNQYLMVRTDKTFLAYDIELTPVNGNLFFTLAEEEDRGEGNLPYTLPVPLGELELILKDTGQSLIPGLDYIMHFPVIHIVNQRYLTQPADTAIQRLHVRYTGFCPKNLSTTEPGDYGFVINGMLSDNNRYDIRDDKVLRITVDGAMMHRDDLVFSETHSGVAVTDPSNGKPYQIKDIVVPLKQLVNENTYSLRAKSLVKDQIVSDYMTLNSPQNDPSVLNAIVQKYAVVSPFLCRIISALQTGEISAAATIATKSDMDFISVCQPYEALLKFDPVNEDNGYDLKYVIIYPHRLNTTMNVTIYQYRFLLRVIALYCKDKVDISSFITFST